jgi:hypothetical protein
LARLSSGMWSTASGSRSMVLIGAPGKYRSDEGA